MPPIIPRNPEITPGALVKSISVPLNRMLRWGDSPDSSASGVVIQRAGSVPPRDVSGRLRYIADHTLQFYRAARFVEFVAGCCAVLVHDLDPRH